MKGMEQALEAFGPVDSCRNWSEKLERGFIIIRMRSYLPKENGHSFKCNLQEHHFYSFMK